MTLKISLYCQYKTWIPPLLNWHLKIFYKFATLQKINIIFCISFFILFGFFLYGNSTQGKFVWDDSFLVSNNPHIMSLTKIPQLFTEDVGAGVNRQYNFYRPLQMLSFALDYFFWKDNVFGFHLTNIFIHVLVAISIFFLVRILFTDIFSAFLTASWLWRYAVMSAFSCMGLVMTLL